MAVAGVNYLNPNAGGGGIPPAGDPMAAGMRGFQMGQALGGAVRKKIDKAKHKRKLDRFLSGMTKEDKPLTRQQMIEAASLMGPEAAKMLMTYETNRRQMAKDQREESKMVFGQTVDFAGAVTDNLRNMTPEQRQEAFVKMVTPFAQDPHMQQVMKPVASFFQDGDFSDEKLKMVSGFSALAGRYHDVLNKRDKRGHELKKQGVAEAGKTSRSAADITSREGIADADRTSRESIAGTKKGGMPLKQAVAEGRSLHKKHGGKLATLIAYAKGDIIEDKNSAGGGRINAATGETVDPKDFGTLFQSSLPANSTLGTNDKPGGPNNFRWKNNQ